MPNGCNFFKRVSDNQTKCCNAHDRAYVHRTMSKFSADKMLAKCFWYDGHKVQAVFTFLATSTIGWFWWLKYRLRK